MSDNQLPSRGQALHELRDLDEAVLSGDTGRVPASWRPAAAAMAALRSVPAPSELSGEAAARAAYRLFVLPDGGWPARTAASPLITAEPAGRPHSHRRVSRRPWRGRPAAALLGAAAVAACVVAVVCAVASSGGSSGQPGHTALATQSPSPVGGKQPVLEGGANPARTPTPAGTAAASSRATAGTGQPSGLQLCRQWASVFRLAERSGDWSAERSLEKQLSSLARGERIIGYCAQFSHSPWSNGPAAPQLGPAGPAPEGWGSGAHGEMGAVRTGAGSAAAFRG
ncbi:MAG TPA: hypothetical protein VHV09_18820 [Trebonia sp.]|jgi:hypothetical protein|nr:hypothetical protein [Trebonia sp.]